MNFADCRQRYSILNTLLNTPNRTLKVYLTEGILTPMNTVNPWKQLKLVRYISFHLWLLPHIHPTKPNQLSIFHSSVFPKLCKIVTILTSRVNHLHYPELIGIPQQMIIVVRSESSGLRWDLSDIAAALIIMFTLLRVPKNLPRLHNCIKFLCTGVAARVLIRMILHD